MFDETDPYVQFKLDFMRRAMPANSAIVYGDMYMIEGGFTKKCLDFGCKDVLLIDMFETAKWQQSRIERPQLDFYKGDFSNPSFMRSFDRKFNVGVAYEVLLHQAPLLHTLHLMLEKVTHKLCIVQPMLKEQSSPNALVYLPGNPLSALYPMSAPNAEFQMFDIREVNASRWIWGMTVSFLKAALVGEGFEVTFENEIFQHGLTDHWRLWGCVAERTSERNPEHWSSTRPIPGLKHFDW